MPLSRLPAPSAQRTLYKQLSRPPLIPSSRFSIGALHSYPSLIRSRRNFHHSPISFTMNTATKDFLEAIKVRRSTYTLSSESTLSVPEIEDILKTTLEEAPSTFGSYTTRIVLVAGEEHKKTWAAMTEVIKNVTPAEMWESHTKPRLEGFSKAYGTGTVTFFRRSSHVKLTLRAVLFWEDPENTKILQEKYTFAADKFPLWSEHTSAIHQFIIWTALTNAGMGANLQHYNPLVNRKLQEMYNVPKEWNLVAQMVFGKPTAPAGPKSVVMKKPLEERLMVHSS